MERIDEHGAADSAVSSAGAPARTVFVKTYGCQMNVYDSERMIETLAAEGYAPVADAAAADLVLLNTCHIRERASEKVYSDLGRLRAISDERVAAGGARMTIGVAGCVAQAEGAEIRRRQPRVDLVVGPQSYHRLPQLLRDVAGGAPQIETEFPIDDKFDHLPAAPTRAGRAKGPAAFLTIQEGCDKFCSFCVVPFTRGAEMSRPAARVLDEARALVAAGVREITLLGQNVNAYHGAAPDGGADWGLGRLLEALAKVEGVARLRYTTSHPNDMDDALIAAHRDIPAVMPYLHLPVQSGSDRILVAMNRRHGVAAFEAIVDRLRAVRPDLALSSDFIVGFPGETEAEFAATLALVARVGFAQAYSFKYSPRPGTPAAEAEQVADEVRAERLARLQALLLEQQGAFLRSMVGRRLEVLLEKPGRRPGQLVGRSPYLHSVHLEIPDDRPDARIGALVEVDVLADGPNSLAGRLTSAPAR